MSSIAELMSSVDEKWLEWIKWQTMSTVPHDGTEVLLLLSNNTVIIAFDKINPRKPKGRWWRTGTKVTVPVEESFDPALLVYESVKAIGWRRIRFPGDVNVL